MEFDKQEIDSIKISGQVFKVGYDAYAAYDFISRISQIKALIKNGVVIVNIYHKIDQVFDEGGCLRDVTSDKQYLYKTFISPGHLEIRYKNTELYEECDQFQSSLQNKGAQDESIS